MACREFILKFSLLRMSNLDELIITKKLFYEENIFIVLNEFCINLV